MASHAYSEIVPGTTAAGSASVQKKSLGQMWFGVATTRGQHCVSLVPHVASCISGGAVGSRQQQTGVCSALPAFP